MVHGARRGSIRRRPPATGQHSPAAGTRDRRARSAHTAGRRRLADDARQRDPSAGADRRPARHRAVDRRCTGHPCRGRGGSRCGHPRRTCPPGDPRVPSRRPGGLHRRSHATGRLGAGPGPCPSPGDAGRTRTDPLTRARTGPLTRVRTRPVFVAVAVARVDRPRDRLRGTDAAARTDGSADPECRAGPVGRAGDVAGPDATGAGRARDPAGTGRSARTVDTRVPSRGSESRLPGRAAHRRHKP